MVAPPCPFRAKTSRKRCVHPARSWRRRGGHWQRLRGSTTQLSAPNEGIFTVFCLLPAAILRMSAIKLRSTVIRQLNAVETSELFNTSVQSEKHSPSDFVQRLESIRRGAYAPMLNQPAVLAILTPMGGLGSLALVKLFFTYVV